MAAPYRNYDAARIGILKSTNNSYNQAACTTKVLREGWKRPYSEEYKSRDGASSRLPYINPQSSRHDPRGKPFHGPDLRVLRTGLPFFPQATIMTVK